MLTELSPKTRPVHPKAFMQAKELQALLMDAARDAECTGPALAQVARAWSELEERKRVLKMKPKPKDIEVGDETSCGLVYATSKAIAHKNDWYKFQDIVLTSRHAILDGVAELVQTDRAQAQQIEDLDLLGRRLRVDVRVRRRRPARKGRTTAPAKRDDAEAGHPDDERKQQEPLR